MSRTALVFVKQVPDTQNITGDAMKAWVDGVRPYGDEMLQALRDRGCDKTDEVLKIWEDAIANYNGRFA